MNLPRSTAVLWTVYSIFFVNSDNKWGYRDLSHARQVLGFVPQDSAEDHR